MLDSSAPLFDLDPQLRKEVLSIFLKESEEEVSLLKHAFETRNWKTAAASAHKLKGSGRMIGALGFSRTASAIERAFDEQKQLTDEYWIALEKQYELLQSHLSGSNPF